MKRLPSYPLHSKFEAPTKHRLERQSPNHLTKALQQKYRIRSSACNQPLEMLQNYEDWQAKTPAIILDIPGIQAMEHHTDEELRSLVLEALSVAYPSTTQARTYTDWSAEETAKMAGVEFSSSPRWQIHQEVCGCRAAVNKLQSWSLRLAHSSSDPEPRGETSYQHSVFDWLPVHPAESSITRRGPDLQQHRTGAVPTLEQNICNFPVDPFSLWCWRQWGSRPAVKKREASWSNLHTPCLTAKQRPS